MKTSAKVVLTFFICLFPWYKLLSQELQFEHLNERDGLQQVNITALYQGRFGFIWIGTDNGLFRYGGSSFDKFFNNQDSSGLDATVLDIHSNYRFVFSLSPRFVQRIDRTTREIKTFILPQKIKLPQKILAMENEIFIAAENGLWILDPITGAVNQSKIHETVTDLKILKTGVSLVATIESFILYFPFSKKFIPINYTPASYIKYLCTENSNTISWIEADNIFHKASLDGNRLKLQISLPLTIDASINCFGKYGNHYFLGTNKGLISFTQNGITNYFSENDKDFTSLSHNEVTCLFADQTNNLWVGTRLGGLNLFQPYRHKFGIISPQISTRYSACKDIQCFSEMPDGKILFQSSVAGLGVFNPLNKEIEKWTPNSFQGNCIFKSKTHEYLIGTGTGLYSFNPNTDKYTFLSTKTPTKLFESDIKSIVNGEGNGLWMGGNDGLFLFDPILKKTLLYYDIGNSQLGSDNIRHLFKYSPDRIMVSTFMGLYSFQPSKGTFHLIPLGNRKKQPKVVCTHKDLFGNLWVATAVEGIYIMRNGVFIKHLPTTDISSNLNHIYAMLMSKDGKCWLSTNAGLISIDCRNFKTMSYDLNDGIQGSEFIESSSLVTHSGEFYFGGLNGFNYFKPEAVINDTNDCKIHITDFKIFNISQPAKPYYNIEADNNFITFEFNSLDYFLSGGHNYFYKLEGLHSEWTEIGERHFASFGQLPQGDYVFRVKVRNPDGNISEHEASVHFSVVPPFYRSGWFRFVAAIFMAMIIALVLYVRIKTALKEEKEKGKQSRMIAELELKALRAQMNPHFIFNSLNSIQDFVLNNEGQQAARYLSKFARLMRMILDISEQTFVSIREKLDFLKLYIELECLRMNNSFEWEFDIDPEIDQEGKIPTLILQPHIENAIWHGLQHKVGSKHLHIKLSKISDYLLKVEIIDNGIGRQAALEIKKNRSVLHHSKGSKITDERIASLSKLFDSNPKVEIVDLFDENKLACGTKVILEIPVLHG